MGCELHFFPLETLREQASIGAEPDTQQTSPLSILAATAGRHPIPLHAPAKHQRYRQRTPGMNDDDASKDSQQRGWRDDDETRTFSKDSSSASQHPNPDHGIRAQRWSSRGITWDDGDLQHRTSGILRGDARAFAQDRQPLQQPRPKSENLTKQQEEYVRHDKSESFAVNNARTRTLPRSTRRARVRPNGP